ncbi:MAG: hypothetical protein ACI8W8_002570, partial [Rhodothermales bacterium]
MFHSCSRWLLLALILTTPSLFAQEADGEIGDGVAAVGGVTGIVGYLVLSTILVIVIGFAGRFVGGSAPSEFYQ